MEFKGTKGSWELRISSYRDYIAIDGERQANSDNRSILYKQFNPTENPTKQQEEYYNEWKANAQLIASSPDLLEALKELVNEIKLQQDEIPKSNDRIWDRVYNSEKAIKKAIG